MDTKEQLTTELSVWKGGRVVADFCLQAIQRAALLAAISAAAKITGNVFISIIETITLLLIFAWMIYTGAMASRWIKIQTMDRPKTFKIVTAAAFAGEFLLMGLLFMAVTSFADVMAQHMATTQ